MIGFSKQRRALGAWLAAVTCVLLVVGCGGGGSGGAWSAPTTPTTPTNPTTPVDPAPPVTLSPPVPADNAPTLFTLAGDTGSAVASGANYRYGVVNAVMSVTSEGNRLNVEVEGEERWSGIFVLPDSLSTLRVGHYESRQGWPFHEPALGGATWMGEGVICAPSSATLDIDKVTYSGNTLRAIEMRFVLFCGSQAGAAVRGTVRWAADDATPRTQPLAIPDTLWRAPASAVPGSGNYVYVTGDTLHFIIQGDTFLYRSDASVMAVSTLDRGVAVAVTSAERWDMRFVPMAPETKLQVGYYAFLSGKNNPALGFMGVGGGAANRGCERNRGWFVVERADYNGAQLTALDLRFEMKCGDLPGYMRGQVHWRIGDASQPAGPANPMPAGLWSPPADALPASGNAYYLESDAGDVVGRGEKVLHTNADGMFTPGRFANGLSFRINGDRHWGTLFLPMSVLSRLEPGYYGNLSNNAALGSITVSNNMYNCQYGTVGWFAVDSVSYNSVGELTSIDMRFEQRCDVSTAALRGRLRWSTADPLRPTPPINPPPAGLWAPAPGDLPAAGNYVYLESADREYIGDGRRYLYTTLNAVFGVDQDFRIHVAADEKWVGDFRFIYSDTGWKPGYYAKTQRTAVFNPARGGLSWSGEGRGCNVSNGWIAIDAVHYDAGGLHDIELRFEQYCDGGQLPLRGKLRWNRDDPGVAPGPVNPPPATLWSAPADRLPASGSYLYIESDPTDFVGSGRTGQAQTYVYPLQGSRLLNFSRPEAIDFRYDTPDGMWIVTAVPMVSVSQLLPGLYADVRQFGTHNPAKGGLTVEGSSRVCNTSRGWYVIDAIRFENGRMTLLDMRFEQRCDGSTGSLRGQIHWVS